MCARAMAQSISCPNLARRFVELRSTPSRVRKAALGARPRRGEQWLRSLTPREFEVMELHTTGALNKQIGAAWRKRPSRFTAAVMRNWGHLGVALLRLVEKAEIPRPERS